MTSVLEQAIEVFHNSECGSAEEAVALYAIKMTMLAADIEVLRQLMFQGPVWDGDIISKTSRDRLLDWKLATRCCFEGEQGYTIATYPAFSVSKALGLVIDPERLKKEAASVKD